MRFPAMSRLSVIGVLALNEPEARNRVAPPSGASRRQRAKAANPASGAHKRPRKDWTGASGDAPTPAATSAGRPLGRHHDLVEGIPIAAHRHNVTTGSEVDRPVVTERAPCRHNVPSAEWWWKVNVTKWRARRHAPSEGWRGPALGGMHRRNGGLGPGVTAGRVPLAGRRFGGVWVATGRTNRALINVNRWRATKVSRSSPVIRTQPRREKRIGHYQPTVPLDDVFVEQQRL